MRNAFNRLVVTLLAIKMIVAGGIAAVAAWSPTYRESLSAAGPDLARLMQMLPADPANVIPYGAGALLTVLVGVVLLWIEVRPGPRVDRILIRQDSYGEVAVVLDSVRRLADHVVQRLPAVRDVRSRVVTTPRGVRVQCRLAIDEQASVPDLSQEVQRQVGEALAQHLGRPVENVSVTTQITPLTQSRRRVQ